MALSNWDYTPQQYTDSIANFPLDLGINYAIGKMNLSRALEEGAATVLVPPDGLPNFADVFTVQATELLPRMVTTAEQTGRADIPQNYSFGDLVLEG